MVGLLGWEGEEMGSLELIGNCGVAISRLVRDMIPVIKCMGYMSIPRALWDRPEELLHRPTGNFGKSAFPLQGPHLPELAWSPGGFVIAWRLVLPWKPLLSLTAVVHVASTSLVEAEQVASASLIAAV